MTENEIREPVQKRSIEKKEKIINAGFDLICQKGYYNTNTAEIAKSAGVSTGIIYQYFKDKHDILLAGVEKYASDIFYPMLNIATTKFEKKDLDKILRTMIKKFIENHKHQIPESTQILYYLKNCGYEVNLKSFASKECANEIIKLLENAL